MCMCVCVCGGGGAWFACLCCHGTAPPVAPTAPPPHPTHTRKTAASSLSKGGARLRGAGGGAYSRLGIGSADVLD